MADLSATSTDVPGGTLVSVGYEGGDAAGLIDRLVSLGVNTLADVRLTPLSRKRGLSKVGLGQALADVGIGYVHLRALGNPRDNRDGLRAGTDTARQRFLIGLRDPAAVAALDELGRLATDDAVAVLCFEADHDRCHRALVIDAVLDRHPSLTLVRA